MPDPMQIDISATGVTAAAKGMAEVAKRLEEVERRQEEVLNGAKQVQAAAKAAQDGGGSATTAAKQRFTAGPNQRRLRIAEQRERLKEVADPKLRAAIGADLDQSDFMAQRSIKLHERRMQNPEESLNRPGLLELFGDMNGMLRDLKHGNFLGVGRRLSESLDISLHPGGRNIEQRLAGAVGGKAGKPGGLPDLGALLKGLGGKAAGGAAEAAGGAAEAGAAAGGAAEAAAGGGLLGLGAAAGPIGLGIAAAVAGMALFVDVSVKAAHAFAEEVGRAAAAAREYATAGSVSGGAPGELSRLTAAGFSPGEAAGSANALRERLANDGLAQFTFRKLGGGTVLPSAYSGEQDNAKLYLQALEGLRGLERERQALLAQGRGAEAAAKGEEQLREARILGMEAAVDLTRVSESTWQQERRQAEGRSAILRYSEGPARELAAQTRLVGDEWDDLKASLSTPFIKPAEEALGGFNKILQGFVDMKTGQQGMSDDFTSGFLDAMIPGLPELRLLGRAEDVPAATTPTDPNGDLQDGMDTLTKAILELVQTWKRTFGVNGPRGQALANRAIFNDPGYSHIREDLMNHGAHLMGPWDA